MAMGAPERARGTRKSQSIIPQPSLCGDWAVSYRLFSPMAVLSFIQEASKYLSPASTLDMGATSDKASRAFSMCGALSHRAPAPGTVSAGFSQPRRFVQQSITSVSRHRSAPPIPTITSARRRSTKGFLRAPVRGSRCVWPPRD